MEMANITPNNSQIQKIIVAKTGTDTATRKRLNFIEGSNITITVADNPGSDRVDITFTGSAASLVDSVFGRTGAITAQSGDYTTSLVTEGSNLYYTQGRFDSAFAAKTTSNLAEGSNLYFTNLRFDTRFSTKTTSDLVEGSNLYYTSSRFNTAFSAKSTSDLSEGSNLYFTNSRAIGALPTQTGNAGKVLSTDGSILSWISGGVQTFAALTDITNSTAPSNVKITSSQFEFVSALGDDNSYSLITPSNLDWYTENTLSNSFGELSILAGVSSLAAGQGAANATISALIDGNGIAFNQFNGGLRHLDVIYSSSITELEYGHTSHVFNTAPAGNVKVNKIKAGSLFYISNNCGSSVTLIQNTSETFNGASTYVIADGESAIFYQADLSGVFGAQTFGVTGGGGGTPGGADTNIQYNNGGAFGGDSQLNFEDSLKRVGIQVTAANAAASLHVDAVYGDTLAAPASSSATLVLDSAIDSPASASASEILSPALASAPTVTLVQIDYPTAGSAAYGGTSGSYIAQGQTINYRLLVYRVAIGGALVTNPTPYDFSYTDTLNDSSTFAVDISGIASSVGNHDGFILLRSTNGGSSYDWQVDIGSSSTYTDTEFTSTVTFENSIYSESGSVWNAYVAQYFSLGGSHIRSVYTQGSTTDSNAGQYLLLNVNSYGSLTEDGFIVQSNNGYYFDIATALSYSDWGQTSGSISDYIDFDTVSFPIFNTSLTNSSSTTTQIDYGYGNLTADGSSYFVNIYEYKIFNGVKYYYPSPDASSTVTDDMSFNSMSISGGTIIGDGDGRVCILFRNSSPIGSVDMSGSTSTYSGLDNSTVIDVSNSISSYSGTFRQFNCYGRVTSPSTKYSSTPNAYTFTDTNTAKYIIEHTYATFGNATELKTLQTSNQGNGSLNGLSGITSNFYQYSTAGYGDTTVTPNTTGFLSNGSNLNRVYRTYSTKSVNGLVIFSSTYSQATTTDPNDGLYYNIDLTNVSVSGATYKRYRTVNGGAAEYHADGGTTLQDNTSLTWTNTSSTLTPTEAPAGTAIFDRASSANTDYSNVIIRNKTSNAYASFLEFQANQSGTYTSILRIGVKGASDSANICIAPTGNVGSGAIDIGPMSAPFLRLLGGTVYNGIVFNQQAASGKDALFKASSSGTLAHFDTVNNTVYFGAINGNLTNDTTCAVLIKPKDTSDSGLVLYPTNGSADAGLIARLTNSSNSTFWGVSNAGRMAVFASSSANGNLRIGASNSSYTQIQLDSSGTLPSTPISGGIEYQSGMFYGSDNASTRRRFVQALASGTSTQFWRSDANGYPTADNTLFVQSGVVLAANLIFQAKQGVALDSGKDLSMGAGSKILGNIGYTYQSISANTTANTSNYYYNATANSFNFTLLTSVSVSGRKYVLKNSGTGNITVLTTSGQSIDNFASGEIIVYPNETYVFFADGANWKIESYYAQTNNPIGMQVFS